MTEIRWGDIVTPRNNPGWHYVIRVAQRDWVCGGGDHMPGNPHERWSGCGKTIREGDLHASPTQGTRPHYCLNCVEKING